MVISVASADVIVGTGTYNFTINVSDGGSPLDGVNSTLLNGTEPSLGEIIIVDGDIKAGLTNSSGGLDFINLTDGHNYSLDLQKRGYYPNESVSSFNASLESMINISLQEDYIPPNISIDTPSNNSVFSTGTRNIGFTVSDDLETDELNVSLYISRDDASFEQEDSQNFTEGSHEFQIDMSSEGKYELYLSAKDYVGNINYTDNLTLFVDETNPSFDNLSLIPGDRQNASQYVNLSAYINSTYSYIDTLDLYVDGAIDRNANLSQGEISESEFNLGYMLPNSSIGDYVELHYCFTDGGPATDEICTNPLEVFVTDNMSPEIINYIQGLHTTSDSTLEFWVEAIDNSPDDLEINISLFNGSDYVLNLTNSTHDGNDNYTFSEDLSQYSLSEMNYTVDINVSDGFNNTNSSTDWLVVDDESPEVNATLFPSRARYGDSFDLNATIIDNYNHSLEDFIVEVDVYLGDEYITTAPLIYSSDNLWNVSGSIDNELFEDDDTYDLNVTATDLAGNVAFNDSLSFELDNEPPEINISRPDPLEVFYGNDSVDVNLTYTLSADAENAYYTFTGETYDLPADTENSLKISDSIIYPGLSSATISAEDDLGNIGSETVTFYTNFLFNTTSWTDMIDSYNAFLTGVSIFDDSGTSLSGLINITMNETGIVSLTHPSGHANLTTRFNESNLNYNFSSEGYFSSFDEEYKFYHGSEIVDMLRFENITELDIESMSYFFDTNTSNFDDVVICTDNYFDCEEISSSYYEDHNGGVLIDSPDISFTDNRYNSVLLTEDTLPPRINVTSPANGTSFDSPYGNSINLTINEQSSCRMAIYNSSDSLMKNESIGLSEIDQGGYSTYDAEDLGITAPPYVIDAYSMDIICDDSKDNEASYNFEFSISDDEAPPIDFDPSFGQSFAHDRESFELEVTTSPHPSVCRITDDEGDDLAEGDGSLIGSDDNLTHTYDIDNLTEDSSYEYFVRCTNYNNISVDDTYEFSVDSEPEEDTEEDTDGSAGGNLISDDDDDSDDDEVDNTFQSEEFSYSSIDAGEIVEMAVSSEDMPVSSIRLSPDEELTNIFFTLESFKDMNMFKVMAEGLTDVHRYIQLIEENDQNFSKFGDFEMSFKVSESWVTQNSLDHEDILIGMYDEEIEEWDVLEKEFEEKSGGFYIYNVTSKPSRLFAISRIDESVEKPDEDNGSENPSGTIVGDDEDDDIRNEIDQRSMSIEDVIKVVSIIVGVIFLTAIVYGNRDLIAKSFANREKKKKEKGERPKKNDVGKEKKENGSDAPEQNKTYDHASPSKLNQLEKLKEIPMSSMNIDSPRDDVLRSYLTTLYRNIWIRGYNDKSICKELQKEGYSEKKIVDALTHIKNDAAGSLSTILDPELKSIVAKMRNMIVNKYGLAANGLFSTLKSKGWPTYMIKSSMETVRTRMNAPLQGSLEDMSSDMSSDFSTKYDTSELEKYVKDALENGVDQGEVLKKASEAGWPEDVAEKIVLKYSKV